MTWVPVTIYIKWSSSLKVQQDSSVKKTNDGEWQQNISE